MLWQVYAAVLAKRPKPEAHERYTMLCQILSTFIQSLAPVLENSNLQNWASVLIQVRARGEGVRACARVKRRAAQPVTACRGRSRRSVGSRQQSMASL